MERSKRYRHRGRLIVDMHFAGYMMAQLYFSTGIENGNWITSRKIKNVTSHMQESESKLDRRIGLLVKSGFLRRKKMSKAEKIRIYGTNPGGCHYIYTMGSAGKSYLEKYRHFTSSKGWLMQKGKRKIMEEPREIQQPQESQTKQEEDEYGYILK